MNVTGTNSVDTAQARKTKVVASTAAGLALLAGTALAIHKGKGAQAGDQFTKLAEDAAPAAEAAAEKTKQTLGQKLSGALHTAGAFLKKAGKVIAWPFQKAWQGIKYVATKISALFAKKAAPAAEATQGLADKADKVTEGVQSLIG